ncbi:DUF262 domain-containing protein [Dictyobacter aurantiacus]|uniref:GmrSD restriction endonucleases N-terminal domain-containing protein n=1 Tax=Dictyobacter aurantiacus TaxID=1936993 RepID=A0A401ZAT6_9CHLR|nr:DUF262 domain-containing protein [Dictyobacter aurantiacus]GCE03959.1 hypothetical protein KDAU_12880 [Dictyobacter aurantiacus]
MDLQQEIDARRAEIRSDNYAMSIGELISLYENEEIDIHPEFQRFYRWDAWQKSRLIESLLLGIPIPPIFVSQREDGVWDVVDGLQRLSTIFEFAGVLQDEHKKVKPPLVLMETKYLPSLNGVVWGDSSEDQQHKLQLRQTSLIDEAPSAPKALNKTQRLLIKRAKIQVSIILKESDERSKYDLFQRLNTGGSSLSSQELRNCILVSTNHHMYEWIRDLSQDENFTSCVSLTDRAIDEQYDVELVLRFLVFRSLEGEILKNIGDLDDFLTRQMEKIALSKDYDMEKESTYFKGTFSLLANTTKGNSFRKYDAAKNKFTGGFLVSAFEMVALGIGYNLDFINTHPVDIEEKIKQIWSTREFTRNSGSGVRASTRIAKTIPLSRRLFRP